MLLRILRTHLAPYKPWLAAIVVLQFTATVAMLYLPSLNADIIDKVWPWATPATSGTSAGSCSVSRWSRSSARSSRSPARPERRCRSAATCARRSSTGSGPSRPRGRAVRRAVPDHPQHQRRPAGADARPAPCTLAVQVPIMMVGGIVMAMREDLGLSWLLAVVVPALFLVRRPRRLPDGAELPPGPVPHRRREPDPARADQRHPRGPRVRPRAPRDRSGSPRPTTGSPRSRSAPAAGWRRCSRW